MKIGFLFPGQGSQFVGMGKDIYDEYEVARNVYQKVKVITGIDIANISFNGPEEVLNETNNTQLAILTQSLATVEVLKEKGIKAEISCGLSLGEYSSLIYSKLFNFSDGIKIVQKRGQLMSEFNPIGNWKMAAIIGLEDDKVEEACKKVTSGFVIPANYNCDGQVAISGEEEAVIEAGEIAKEMGARKVMVLNTAGPFHTEKFIQASNGLREELEKITFNKFETKVIKNLDGKFYSENDDIKDILSKHIISSVRFSDSLRLMVNSGVDTFIEIGPGKSLSGFVKRMKLDEDKEIKILNISDLNSLEKTLSILKEEI